MALALAVTAALLGAWIALAQPRLPEPLRRADLRPGELRWFADDTVVAYVRGEARAGSVLFLGDSRVHHALDLDVLRRAGLPSAVLWIGGGGLSELLQAAEELPCERVVVALSPLGVYRESDRAAELALARAIGNRPLTARIDRALDGAAGDLRARCIRTIDAGAWREAWFERARPQATDARQRRDLRPKTRARRAERLAELAESLASLRRAGRQIVCLRLPISESLLAVEEEAFPSAAFRELCARLALPYLDRSAADAATYDGSHLSAAGARRFSAQLARELTRAFDRMDAAPPDEDR